jgi:16S rRNA (adenine1518-N6/adenine1519-N6)-dimethyltransferase
MEAARIEPGETVLDAGAGSGVITQALAAAGAKVVAVEADGVRAQRLRDAGLPGVDVVQGDILKVRLPRLDAIVSNPPFRILPAVLRRLLTHGFGRAVLIVPEELADRLTALPETPHYGKLTVQMGLRARTKVAFPVPKRDLDPPPAVPTVALHVVPKTAALDLDLLDVVLDAAWEGRRRTLRHALAPLAARLPVPPQVVSDTLEECQVRDRVFGEVSPWEFGALAAELKRRAAEASPRRSAKESQHSA